jgi:BON domain
MNAVLVVLALSPFAAQVAIAQHAPTDTKILHDVDAALENERAFRGLPIVPQVSHGVVTLTGTVSSEGDKVLASIEVGRVIGVTTVLNNLEVHAGGAAAPSPSPALTNPNGAQVQSLTRQIPPPNAVIAKTIMVPTNSYLSVRLIEDISTKTAKLGDQFHGTIAAAVLAEGMVAIPAGTPVLGRVVSAKPVGHFISAGELSIELTSLRLPQPNGADEDVSIITESLSTNANRRSNTITKAASGAAAGGIIGALAGGGTGAEIGTASGAGLGLGANAVTSAGQIELRPESLLRFRTAAPLTTTVYQQNGVQIKLPAAAAGPSLSNITRQEAGNR